MLSQQEISRRLGVAFETINRQAKHLGLPMPRLSQWKSSHPSGVLHPRRGKDKAWYRQQWLALLKAHPEASRTHLCRFLPGVHSWLTRHDRAWLDQHLPPPRLQQRIERSEPPSAGTPRIRKFRHEGLEDAELAVRVKATAQQFRSEAERLARITKRRLLLAIPALTVLRSAQHRFPLTAQAVEACQETHEGFGLRKVCWATQRYAEEQVYPTRYQFEVRAGVLAVCEHPLIRQAVDDALRELEPLKGYGLALAAV